MDIDGYLLMVMQKGEAPEALAAAKRELEIKRAASASKGAKVFYKVTVKVSTFTTCLLYTRMTPENALTLDA